MDQSVSQSVIGEVGQLVSQVARQPIEDRYLLTLSVSSFSFSRQVSSFLGRTPRSLGTRIKIDMQISFLVS